MGARDTLYALTLRRSDVPQRGLYFGATGARAGLVGAGARTGLVGATGKLVASTLGLSNSGVVLVSGGVEVVTSLDGKGDRAVGGAAAEALAGCEAALANAEADRP